jgi:hypothetical protein
LLRSQVSNKWPDPQDYKDQAAFLQAYTAMRAESVVYERIVKLLESQEEIVKVIRGRLDEKETSYVL